MTILAGFPDTKDETLLFMSYRDELTVHLRLSSEKTVSSRYLQAIHASYIQVKTSLPKAEDVIYWPTKNSEVKDFFRS